MKTQQIKGAQAALMSRKASRANPAHPEAVAARAREAAVKEQRDNLVQTRQDLEAAYELRFFNRGPRSTKVWDSKLKNYVHDKHHGISVAYRVIRRDVVEVATAICHPSDTFNKQDGEALAAANFALGKTIQLRRPAGRAFPNVTTFIRSTFDPIVD